MTKSNLMTSTETAALVSDAIGVPISARRVNGWAKAGSGSFPPLALAVNGSLIRHSREAVEAWLRERFPDDSKREPRNPDARLERVIRRGRPRARRS
jgi:hypothetical protein